MFTAFPLHLRLLSGNESHPFGVPDPAQRAFAVPRFRRALELGFREGVSINIHAAAGNIEWAGTDFNATQTSFARDLAEASSEARVNLYNDSFAEFAARDVWANSTSSAFTA